MWADSTYKNPSSYPDAGVCTDMFVHELDNYYVQFATVFFLWIEFMPFFNVSCSLVHTKHTHTHTHTHMHTRAHTHTHTHAHTHTRTHTRAHTHTHAHTHMRTHTHTHTCTHVHTLTNNIQFCRSRSQRKSQVAHLVTAHHVISHHNLFQLANHNGSDFDISTMLWNRNGKKVSRRN